MGNSTKSSHEKSLRHVYDYDVRNKVGSGLRALGYRE
jgi:hypothetical protein